MLLRRLLLSLSLGACLLVPAQAAELTLRYAQPAPDTPEGWEQQALPIGNGRLGAMLFGNLARERLPFNDITLWRGDRQQMGAYQPFGDVRLTLQGHAAAPTHYERRLQLKPGRFELDYTVDGVRFHRQAFASFPAQVIVLRLTADAPGRYSGWLQLSDRHGGALGGSGLRLQTHGRLPNGLRMASQLQLLHEGGRAWREEPPPAPAAPSGALTCRARRRCRARASRRRTPRPAGPLGRRGCGQSDVPAPFSERMRNK